jgi:uncharacterized membrane protein
MLRINWRQPYNWYLGVLITINTLPILAPIFAKLAESSSFFEIPAKLIYFVYSFTCHQFVHRSFLAFDYQFGWCARDVGIWLGILLIAILARNEKFKGIKWYWVFPFIMPIALDGGIQTLATLFGLQGIAGGTTDIVYVSNNLIRFMTGAIFGIGVSAFLSPNLYRTFKNKEIAPNVTDLTKKFLILAVSIALIFYFGVVQLWNSTSVNYVPTDILDTAVKTPAQELFARRAHGLCPSTQEDLFRFDCFF